MASFKIGIASVLNDLKNAQRNGVREWYTCFDPFPKGNYYSKLFDEIRKKRLFFKAYFECWALPTKKFIDDFSLTFDKNSVIAISPECGSEKVRKKNKGFFYTNKNLINIIKYTQDKGLNTLLYFTAGLPFEKNDDFLATLFLINHIRRNFPSVHFSIMSVEMEPGSPWFVNNDRYKIRTGRKKFIDFYNLHKDTYSIGYATQFFSEVEIANALRILNAEARCKFAESPFIKSLSRLDRVHFALSLNKIKQLCSECDYFGKCFPNLDNACFVLSRYE